MKKSFAARTILTLLAFAGSLLGTHQLSATDLYVGSNTPNNNVIISSGSNIYANTYIGNSASASNNQLTEVNSNTIVSASQNLYVGYNGANNSLIISNGATFNQNTTLVDPSIGMNWSTYIGYGTSSSNNQIIVTGTGSTLNANYAGYVPAPLYVGYGGVDNSILITNSGSVVVGQDAYINTSNSVLVTGANSLFNVGNYLYLSGSLAVTNGASATTYRTYLYSNAKLVVSGSNSSYNITYDPLSFLGTSNNVSILNGGTMTTPSAIIQYQGNNVLISGSNSALNTTGSFFRVLSGSTLTTANGGTFSASNLALDYNTTGGMLNIGRYGTNDTTGVINVSTIQTSQAWTTNQGTINFNQRDTSTISSLISGNGVINQLGIGATILSASNTFGGSTIVSAGTLVISATGSLSGSGTTTVNSGGTLQNNGLIAGTTLANGTITGNGGTFGSLKINGGSGLIWDISSLTGIAGTGWDVLNTTNLDLSGMSSSNKMTIYIYGGTGAGNASPSYTFNFLSATNTFSGFNMSNFTIDTSNFLPSVGGTWSIGTNSISGGGEALALTYAVPEPSTYALFGLGALALLIAARRKAA